MRPVNFDQSNFVFQKPEGMTDEQCTELNVCKTNHSDGQPVIVSCWEFSKEDLDEIAKTGKIWLLINGHGMPPVSLEAENPFGA